MSKEELLQKVMEEELRARNRVLRDFIPGVPKSKPFQKQIDYLKDDAHNTLARCGNRAAKTFTNCRDLSWCITKTHWYLPEYNAFGCKSGWWGKIGTDEYEHNYLRSKPTDYWAIGPTYEFLNGVIWDMYCSKMVPEWFVLDIHKTNMGNIDKIYFRNGDVLSFKTYHQQDTSKMGFAVDRIYLDEMPDDPKTVTELIMRTLDRDGHLRLGFTSLVVNEDLRKYIDNSCAAGTISLHQWSLLDNPHYRDNPERLARALAEFAVMSEEERNARLYGHWYHERPSKPIFDGCHLEMVDDFGIPSDWRQVRYVDPAAYVTGLSIYAEDPSDGQWYCILGRELTWKEAVKAETLVQQIETFKPEPDFKYFDSVYDNAEAWFGAYARDLGFRPCILKNREKAIIATRAVVQNKKVKVFKSAAALLKTQFDGYHFKDDGVTIVKKNDHVLDTFMYFCREIPTFIDMRIEENKTEHQRIYEQYRREKESRNRILVPPPGMAARMTERAIMANRLRMRGAR